MWLSTRYHSTLKCILTHNEGRTSSGVSFWVFNYPIHILSSQFSSSAHEKQLMNRETVRLVFRYVRHSPTIVRLPPCAVMYPTQCRTQSPQAVWPAVGRQERPWRNSVHQSLSWRPTANQKAWGLWVRDCTQPGSENWHFFRLKCVEERW